MMSRVVSILIPAYNAERWIAETLKSALGQTWKEKEIIVVDDGSTDGTYEIAKKFESPIVKVVRQENRGAAAARNKAYSICQGEYIQWLDADDLLARDKIELQMNIAARESKLTLLSGAFGIFFMIPERARFVPTSLWKDMSPVDWLCTKFEENLWMNPAVWLMNREDRGMKDFPWMTTVNTLRGLCETLKE